MRQRLQTKILELEPYPELLKVSKNLFPWYSLIVNPTIKSENKIRQIIKIQSGKLVSLVQWIVCLSKDSLKPHRIHIVVVCLFNNEHFLFLSDI